MLNNPPEDAPRKPGIFPKTCKKKTIPFEAIQDTPGNILIRTVKRLLVYITV